ncbi:cytochrome P450 [Rhypophila decipiens]
MAFEHVLQSLSYLHLGAIAGVAITGYTLYGIIWRLYFSPIAHIPGPRLAAITWWYEFYYDIILSGQYTFKILELHKQYGPIIRINPDEVHIGDPDFFPQLYPASNKRRERWRFWTKQFGADESGLSTIDHDLHRIRRAAISPFFSQRSVRDIQPVIEERVDTLLARFHEHGKASPEIPLDVFYPLSAFTNDVINEYSFARCDHLTEKPDYGRSVTDYLLTGTHYGKWIQHIELILKFINFLPDSISSTLVPGWNEFLKAKREILDQISSIKQTENTPKWQLDVSHPTIFHDLLSSEILTPQDKAVSRLAQEGQIVVQAGTLTTSWALTIAIFFLLEQKPLLAKLRRELCTAIPDPNAVTPLATLEQLPYLRAVIKEAFRHSIGTSGRLARVCTDETLTYIDKSVENKAPKVYHIPPNVPISMTTYKTTTDESIFPDPFAFKPERWLQGDSEHQARLDGYLTVFGGGGRSCLGQALSYAELTLALAKMFRVWGSAEDDDDENSRGDGDDSQLERPSQTMRIAEGTTARDTRMAEDWFIPIPWRGSKGVRVYFKSN